jgi:hypothetical protein
MTGSTVHTTIIGPAGALSSKKGKNEQKNFRPPKLNRDNLRSSCAGGT